jgi:hypothetical protein
MDIAALIGIGVVSAVLYMTIGIGAARAIKMAERRDDIDDIDLRYVFMWPAALCVFAFRMF